MPSLECDSVNEPPSEGANGSIGMPVVCGVRLDDGLGIPAESQELFVKKRGEARDRGRDERACQLCLRDSADSPATRPAAWAT